MAQIPDEVAIQSIRKAIFDNLAWSKEHTTFLSRVKLRNDFLARHEVPFTLALQVNVRRSFFGTYLDFFNRPQNQDRFFNENKFGIMKWDMKNLSPEEVDKLNGRNTATDDMFSLLTDAVKQREKIDWDFLYEKVEALRIVDYNINVLDGGVRKFENLQILVLSGNWITDVPGAHMPRKLKFLELFANQVCNLESLTRGAPKDILHIGLGKNRLDDGCRLDLLDKCGKFRQLRTLDLTDNDLYDLKLVLESLQGLNQLVGLLLEGNPCSVCQSYKNLVLKYLPNLLFLDSTEVQKEDRIDDDIVDDDPYKAAIVFTCHRIFGLPPPPKEKGVAQTIHVEVVLPLLQEIVVEPEVVEDEIVDVPKPEKKGKGKKDKGKKGKGKKTKNDKAKRKGSNKSKKSSKKGKKAPSPYDVPDEYEGEIKRKIKNSSFKTERVPWQKMIQFPEEAVVVESLENDLKAIRDSFRSSVNVKVVYLKILPPEKKKKGKGKKKKGKGAKGSKGKKDKNKRKSKGDKSTVESTDVKQTEEEEPKETIVKKVTLANFHCDLHSINWSDRTIDYFWADHPKTNPKALSVEGSLRAINYVEGKKKGKETAKKDNAHKGKVERKEVAEELDLKVNELTKVCSKEFIPNIFTCQVGFGLKRFGV